ncbi:Protein CL16A [Mortierella sp. AM989]|nr:Protein CL16A [Mortierella sp. AM989]
MFNLLWNKPKPERFSLENLKLLCAQLQHFPGDANEESIISCLKELTQILIWGDQHDPLLLEHFFEENVHWHFLKILKSKHDGSLIVQVLQTLNIMFENVRSRESLYFLLSNNYVNEVIGLKYDFSNDEILAYYIYLLRTLSFKLSKDTIYFFFNEHLDDFPLYSEAIKFFNHEESMVRIAVRVITLNVYSVNDRQMQDFILDRTTTTYFSNLVWFIGHYGTTIDDMLQHQGEGDLSRINYYLAEHVDCFYYVNDIIELEVPKINKILISHLLNRLLRPMYLDSLLPVDALVSTSSKSSASSPKLIPLVALSLMLHAFHVLKHSPLVSALASTLFSNQHYLSQGSNGSGNSKSQSHLRQTPSPLALGGLTTSPESSYPASPVTSKFHSFGLLGSSSASQDSYLSAPSSSTTTPHVHLNHHPFVSQTHPPSLATSILQQQPPQQQQQQQNPFKVAIYEYLSQIDNDRMVLPALTLIYLTGRNPGVMSDVLLGTDIYPQRLLKSRLLMGNLTSSTPPPVAKNVCGSTTMTRERSNDSILSTHSTGATGAWNISSPAPRNLSSINGNLFGAAGSAAAARMKIRTDSPLFELDDDIESRETEELLASEDQDLAQPPTPSAVSNPPQSLASSVPSSMTRPPIMVRGRLDDGDVFSKSKSRSGTRKASKTPSLRIPMLPTSAEESATEKEGDDSDMGQELRPVYTSARDRQISGIYPSTDDELVSDEENAATRNLEPSSGTPPPLPPRRKTDQQQEQQNQEGESKSMQESVSTQAGPTIQNREELIDRLMDIICGQPESGAHRFRIMTIQMATELLIEFVLTKGVVAGKEGGLQGNNSVAQQAAENQLGEERLHRLALAEVQFRDRVRKGIRRLERKKREESTNPPPLGILTGKVERSLTESKLGIDRHIVNIIAESSMIYGPDKDLDKEPDLDPDHELMVLFGLDPEYTSMKHEKIEIEEEKVSQDQQLTSSSPMGSTTRAGRRAKVRSKIKAKIQVGLTPSSVPKSVEQPTRTHRSQLTSLQRLEAMVLRYIKWLHILIQCRQLLCRKAITPAMALLGLHPQAIVATSFFGNSGSGLGKMGSPTISITETVDRKPSLLERRPSDLMSVSSSSTVVSAHKGIQKALATTATTTSTTQKGDKGSATPTVEAGGNEDSRLISSLTSSPASEADSTSNTTPPSISSSLSSLSSATSSSVMGSGGVSATISQPGSGTASGRIIGSRTLLSATAALEAAASSANQNHTPGAGLGFGSSGTHHPFINDMLTNHLDPLSASVSEAIRKSGAKLKKSVVDPLATNTNNLFKYSPAGQHQDITTSTSAPNKGFYRPPYAASSAASSVVSLVRPGSANMQRSLSVSSASSSHSVSAMTPTGADGVFMGIKSTTGSSIGRNSEDHATLNDSSLSSTSASKAIETEDENFLSILDVGHPGHQMDDEVFKILETLGLATASG